MQKTNSQDAPSEVFYDGDCPMCQAFVGQLNESSVGSKFKTRDVTKGSLPQNVTLEQALKEIYVTDSTGTYKNADAMLRILGQNPRFERLARIGTLPILIQILRAGYFFISGHRHYLFGEISKLLWLKFLTIIALVSGILLSLPVWFGERGFPFAPAFEVLQSAPPLVSTIGLFGLLLCLTVAFIYPRPRVALLLFCGFAAALCVLDQMRFQPWFYQYSFMLLLLALFSWDKEDHRGLHTTLSALRIMIAGIYFYSGLQKLNPNFVTEIFPWFASPVLSWMTPSPTSGLVLILVGSSIPLIEMAIGIGLLRRRFRRVAVILALAMFVFLIPTIGPLGHQWNTVVWPWNVAMIAFVCVLFWSDSLQGSKFSGIRAFFVHGSLPQKLVVGLFAIMPSLSFIGLWDSYPSFSLYSGNTTSGFVRLDKSAVEQLPAEAQDYTQLKSGTEFELNLQDWSFKTLGVPLYPEERVYRVIFSSLCDYSSERSNLTLHLELRPHTLKSNTVTYKCKN